MEKLEDQDILDKIASLTGNVTKSPLLVKKKNKKKKKKKKKRKSASVEANKKIVGTKNKKANKLTELCEDNKVLQKREICKFFFRKGKCMHNENCTYSHDVTPIYKISKLCKFLVKGTCGKENCIFSHDYNLFFCRNNVIYNSCYNPSCKFKHIKIDSTINNADQYNLEVDNILSKDDKIRFLYNNKNYLMELLINKYHKFDKCEQLNIDDLVKKETYPWFINGVIDLIKLDYKSSKANTFIKLVENYKNKVFNAKTPFCWNNENIINHGGEGLNIDASTSSDYAKIPVDNSEYNQVGEKETGFNNNNNFDSNYNNIDTNNAENNFSDYKFYSSDEEEDYAKYLNKYFEIDG
ncbi:hypothetical protein, conserved [Plasmodium gonderi]|uniref:C3H1-type domain-containing protein n=1 Tax=Plasmodium gonderi TaxID=77519 RepID=A0A1Y1JPU1_PLAGO|nr:hypothetical protein, conserved [Plasmodium gonderi]GAW82443.1 hypothetical protein, conserved [Plasmodium gonderi]